MGKRGWTFRCLECNNEFGEYFEWLNAAEIKNVTENINCNQCESENWKITNKTSFAGGREQIAEEIAINCRECHSTWYVKFGDLTKTELQELGKNLECVDCGNSNPVITDGINT